MTDQLPFDYPERRARDCESPLVVLRFLDDGYLGKVEAHWVDFGMTSWFRSWAEALPIVLHELNGHVQVRVRP